MHGARVLRRSVLFSTTACLLSLAGCGAVLTGALAGGIFSLSGGKRGGGSSPSRASSASVVGDTSSGTVEFVFTLTNAGSASPLVEVRFSVTPTGGVEDDGTLPFPTRALGTPSSASATPSPAGLATASTTAGGVANDAKLATSPGGISYKFFWNTSQDLSTFDYVNNVRLQILIDGQVAFTVSPFSVDNSFAPQISSVALPALPSPATEYADAQNGSGGLRITLTVADARARNVALSALYSIDGGVTFPTTNVAAGELVDPSANAIVPITSVATTASGKSYIFRFSTISNGLGLTGDQGGLALQFTATDTKTSTARATSVFVVNNATISAAPNTPSTTQVTDTVHFTYQLTDAAGQPLDVIVEYSIDGGTSWATCTELHQPPSEGTNGATGQGLNTSPTGIGHTFIWNAYQDLLVAGGTVASSNLALRITPVRPSTQVRAGPFRTRTFSVDERLIYTVFNTQPGVTDNIPATQAQLVQPGGVAVLAGKVYFSDNGTNRVRVVPLAPNGTTGLSIDTFFGGGASIDDGALARDFALVAPTDLAADPSAPGAIFVCGSVYDLSVADFVAKLFRVDGSTPIVTTLAGDTNNTPYAVCFEPTTPAVYYAELKGPSPTHTEIYRISPNGGTPTLVAGKASGSTGDGPFTNAVLQVAGLAANFNVYPGLVLVTDNVRSRVRALNVTNATQMFGATPVNALSVKTVATSQLSKPIGISIEGVDAVDVTDSGKHEIFRLAASSGPVTVTRFVGKTQGFNGDAATDAKQAKLSFPTRITGDLEGKTAQNPSVGFFFSDAGNVRVRVVEPQAGKDLVQTFAGSTRDLGDGLPAATAQLDHPSSVMALGAGLVVADTFVSRIRQIDTRSTQIGTLAGNGTSGDVGDGGPAVQAVTGSPFGLVAGVNSAIYFSQIGECVVRKIVNTTQGPVIQAVAGIADVASPTTDGQVALTQPLLFPRALAFAGNCIVVACGDGLTPGIVYAINDSAAGAVCANVSVGPGLITAIAGGGTFAPPANALACQLGQPAGVVADKAGNVYIADVSSSAIYKVAAATGQLTVYAGSPGTSGYTDNVDRLSAQFKACTGLCFNEPSETVLYVMDSGNDVVRAINVSLAPVTVQGVTIQPGFVNTVAGTPQATGFSGDGGSALSALLTLENDEGGSNLAAVDSSIGVILAFPDTGNSRIRYVDPLGTIRTYAGGGSLDGDQTTLEPAKTPENANLTRPTALTVAPDGTCYLADQGRIRRVTPDNATQTRIAGTAQMFSGADGPALDAAFNYVETTNPQADVLLDANGPRQLALGTLSGVSVLAIADTLGGLVRLMNLSATTAVQPNGMAPIAAGAVATLPFPAGSFTSPQGVAFTTSGLIVVSDTGGGRLLAANIGAAGPVTCRNLTLAKGAYLATNAIALLSGPQNLAFDGANSVLLVTNESGADAAGPYVVNMLPAGGGAITRFAVTAATPASAGPAVGPGSPGGPVAIALPFGVVAPRGAALDPGNNFFFVDRGSPSVILVSAVDGSFTLVVDKAQTPGFTGDGGIAEQAQLDGPIGAGVDARGTIYVLDGTNFRVRRCRGFP